LRTRRLAFRAELANAVRAVEAIGELDQERRIVNGVAA
jgi:hypothetical protein